jgi:acetyl-CoA acetyltransferase
MGGRLGRSVSIIGAAYTPLGNVQQTPEIKGLTERELFAFACMEAMEDGGIEAKDIDAYYLGMTGPNVNSKMRSAAPQFGEWIGMRGKPTLFHDEACATAAFGLYTGVMAVASGLHDCVISGAVNVNHSVPRPAYPPHIRGPREADAGLAGVNIAIDPAYEKPGTGGIGPLEALIVEYCRTYGVSFAEIENAAVAYMQNQRKQAMLNPKAALITESYEEEARRFGFADVREYLLSNTFNPLLGGLIRARFLGAVVDGASAVIVCATDKARQFTEKPIEVAGIATSSALHKSFGQFPMSCDAYMFGEAYAMAGITDPFAEVNYMGIHDCPVTVIPPVAEAAGYFKAGEGWKYMLEGRVGIDSDKPINTGGGRTQTGHPSAPAFAIEVTEAVMQMRGEGGARQIDDPPRVSAIWGGGSGFNLGAAVLKAL